MCNTIYIRLKVCNTMWHPNCKLDMDMAFRGLHVEKLRCMYVTGYGNTKGYLNMHNIQPDQLQQ